MSTDTKKEVSNQNIHRPTDALVVLQTIDFERLQTLDLDVMVVLYLKGPGKENITAHYTGPVIVKEEHPMGYTVSKIRALPAPKYFVQRENGGEEHAGSTIPSEMLLSRPASLEFAIKDDAKNHYKGIIAFRDEVLPSLFAEGYTQYNPNHTSKFWFHAGKGNVKEPLLCISVDGLRISRTEVDGVKVFTEYDIKRFLELKPKNV